jgi:hypothetical protein
MGCSIQDVRPSVPGLSEDWRLNDPAGRPLEDVRRIRDEIEARVRRLLAM